MRFRLFGLLLFLFLFLLFLRRLSFFWLLRSGWQLGLRLLLRCAATKQFTEEALLRFTFKLLDGFLFMFLPEFYFTVLGKAHVFKLFILLLLLPISLVLNQSRCLSARCTRSCICIVCQSSLLLKSQLLLLSILSGATLTSSRLLLLSLLHISFLQLGCHPHISDFLLCHWSSTFGAFLKASHGSDHICLILFRIFLFFLKHVLELLGTASFRVRHLEAHFEEDRFRSVSLHIELF